MKSENGDVVKLSGSAECKGMCGTDGRMYIIDLFRTTPHDPIFLYGTHRLFCAYLFVIDDDDVVVVIVVVVWFGRERVRVWRVFF